MHVNIDDITSTCPMIAIIATAATPCICQLAVEKHCLNLWQRRLPSNSLTCTIIVPQADLPKSLACLEIGLNVTCAQAVPLRLLGTTRHCCQPSRLQNYREHRPRHTCIIGPPLSASAQPQGLTSHWKGKDKILPDFVVKFSGYK